MSAIPSYTRNERNEPVWQLPFVLSVRRMDNSLVMSMEAGTIKQGDKTGSVNLVLGGFAFVVSVDDPKGSRQYALDLKHVIEQVFELDEQLKEPEKLSSLNL